MTGRFNDYCDSAEFAIIGNTDMPSVNWEIRMPDYGRYGDMGDSRYF